MPLHLHLDFETFSLADIKDVGAYRYAFDPSTEILCAAMALGDGEPVCWSGDPNIEELAPETYESHWSALENPEVLIYAHNAQFEMAICQALLEKTWGIKAPAIERFRCTMSLARRAALPGKLEKLAETLGLTNLKDKRGSALIKKFSMMQKAKASTKAHPEGLPPRRIRPEDDPEAFAQFMEYCKQDVRAEQEVARRLAYFDEPINNANYTLHEIINARGVTVNLGALQNAQRIIEEETEIVSAQFRELTGFEVTQRDKLLKWVNEDGHGLPDLQAETIETFLEEQSEKIGEPSKVEEALRMKQSIAYASIKKVATMLACAGPHDNRIRGMLNHHGATTGRSTNSLVQFQNMKRPTIKHSEDAYREICAGISREMLELCYGPPLEVISSSIRHFVHDSIPRSRDIDTGLCNWCDQYPQNCFCPKVRENQLLDADYSAIEARIVNWLAGQEDALEEYRQGVDRYKVMASAIYGVPVDKVNKHPQRFVGKQCILGCGFGMGPPKFRTTCKKVGGYDLPMGLEETAVYTFRNKHKKVKQFWYDLEKSAKAAILHKGDVYKIGKHLAFKCMDVEGMPFLFLRLPSGRKLAYPRPRISNDQIVHFGHIQGAMWGDVRMWGGVYAENATQAVAADIMLHGAQKAEAKGYAIASLIHDQALAYYRPQQTVEEFVGLLTDLPDWAAGLPLEAEGGLVPFYRKE